MTRRRLLVAGIILLTVGQCFLWFVAASLQWSFRALLSPPPAQIEENTRAALAEFAALGLNLAGLLAFSVRRRGLGGWLLAGILLCDLAGTLLLATVFASPAWWLGSVGAAATLLLLYFLWKGYGGASDSKGTG